LFCEERFERKTREGKRLMLESLLIVSYATGMITLFVLVLWKFDMEFVVRKVKPIETPAPSNLTNIRIPHKGCANRGKCGTKRSENVDQDRVKVLIEKLDGVRVLRSSCSDSFEGKFRVHLPEADWDEIKGLLEELKEKNQ
jgi:hypothetical protein